MYACMLFAVHMDTNCHIHFPDSNRSTYGRERSNQVSITGQGDSLEIARRKIRVSTWVEGGG